MDNLTLATIVVGGLVGLMILGCLVRLCYGRCLRAQRYNQIKGDLGGNKFWVGDNPTDTVEEVLPSVSAEQKELNRQQMAAAKSRFHRAAANFCRSASHEMVLVEDLPFVGTRGRKGHAIVRDALVDQKYGGNFRLMLKIYLMDVPNDYPNSFRLPVPRSGPTSRGGGRLMPWGNKKACKKLSQTLERIEHPYVLKTLRFQVTADHSATMTLQWYSGDGSLRDYIYGVDPTRKFTDKYPALAHHAKYGAKPLRPDVIRRFGRQILEGLLYLESIGLPYYHLHAGNVIIVNGSCRLTDYENGMFGYSHFLHHKIRRLPIHPYVAAFGCVLHEMCTGREIVTPTKKGELDLVLKSSHMEFQSLLDTIFFDKSLSLRALQAHPLFSREDVKIQRPDLVEHLFKRKKVRKLAQSIQERYSKLYKLKKRGLLLDHTADHHAITLDLDGDGDSPRSRSPGSIRSSSRSPSSSRGSRPDTRGERGPDEGDGGANEKRALVSPSVSTGQPAVEKEDDEDDDMFTVTQPEKEDFFASDDSEPDL